MPHHELRLYLLHGIKQHANRDQKRCTPEKEGYLEVHDEIHRQDRDKGEEYRTRKRDPRYDPIDVL